MTDNPATSLAGCRQQDEGVYSGSSLPQMVLPCPIHKAFSNPCLRPDAVSPLGRLRIAEVTLAFPFLDGDTSRSEEYEPCDSCDEVGADRGPNLLAPTKGLTATYVRTYKSDWRQLNAMLHTGSRIPVPRCSRAVRAAYGLKNRMLTTVAGRCHCRRPHHWSEDRRQPTLQPVHRLDTDPKFGQRSLAGGGPARLQCLADKTG